MACADLDAEAAAITVSEIDAGGGQAAAVVADAADPEQCATMLSEAGKALGGIDGLVLNVGIGVGRGLAGTSPEEWDLVMGVNVRAHFLACRAALPEMPEDSSIVFIGSAAGLRPGSGSPSYDSSKAALFGLCRHVGREGAARRIRANVVVPGLIDTPMGRGASAQSSARDRIAARVPLGRQGTPWEIAHATVFLLSEDASYITGQALVVDGGLTAL